MKCIRTTMLRKVRGKHFSLGNNYVRLCIKQALFFFTAVGLYLLTGEGLTGVFACNNHKSSAHFFVMLVTLTFCFIC